MRNKPKLYSILILGLVFLLASSVIGCNQTETWTTYHNPTYGYTIDYPQSWDLDTSDAPNVVLIYSPLWCIDCPVCNIGIVAYEGFLSIDERKNVVLDVLYDNYKDVEVITSHGLDGKWEWVIEYTLTFEGAKGRGKAYIAETSGYPLVVFFVSNAEDWIKCDQVVETFIP